jgi:hypothetical protein
MSLLRNPQQTVLAELHARGGELVQRYRDVLMADDLPAPWRAALERVLHERTALVEALAAAERAYGDLPQVGNAERAWLQSLGDRLSKTLGGEHSLAQRLREADQVWLEGLEEAERLEWTAQQASLLARLADHIRAAQASVQDTCS